MRTPDDIKKGLAICGEEGSCLGKGCPYEEECMMDNMSELERDALALLLQREEQIDLMMIQMHGDCGVCKHRKENRLNTDDVDISARCNECMSLETRPHWEYEGLPALQEKGAKK